MAARAIKNFGFKNLILIRPLCHITDESIYMAMHAKDIVKNISSYESIGEFVDDLNISYLIGTTARVGSEKNPLRIAVPINVLRNILIPTGSRIAILFGNEERGLRNEDLQKCDMVLTIPTSEEYPTLNLSHAVAIVAYELAHSIQTFRELPYRPATKLEKEILTKNFSELIDTIYPDFPEAKRNIYKRIISNMIGRAFLSGREAHSLIGITKRIRKLLCLEHRDHPG